MIVKRADGSIERQVVIGMITDSVLLASVAAKWKPGMLPSKWGNLLGGWCVRYYRKYNKAPQGHIETLFNDWVENGSRDDATVESVEKFLESLNGEFSRRKENANTEFLIEQASNLFVKTSIYELAEELTSLVESGQVTEASQLLRKYEQADLSVKVGLFPFEDEDAFKSAFEKKVEPIITYDGAAGQFFGDAMERNGFIAFMGPEKRGKSWQLMDVAFRAMEQGRRVAYFEVGDMTQDQLFRRMVSRILKKPIKPETYKIPTVIHPSDNKMVDIEYREKTTKNPINSSQIYAICQKYLESHGMQSDSVRVACYPNSSISVVQIDSVIQSWIRGGWIPDVIIVDYADILAPIDSREESREAINSTWKMLRRMSQVYHCLVVTATQTNADSYFQEIITRGNFSGDKRKLAHVTGMLGINQLTDEKEKGLTRLNWVVKRDGDYDETKCLYQAGCLAIANPMILSSF